MPVISARFFIGIKTWHRFAENYTVAHLAQSGDRRQFISARIFETLGKAARMLIPVILWGGAASRLWPVSREAYPKPFIRLRDGKTLLQKTIERAARVGTAD